MWFCSVWNVCHSSGYIRNLFYWFVAFFSLFRMWYIRQWSSSRSSSVVSQSFLNDMGWFLKTCWGCDMLKSSANLSPDSSTSAHWQCNGLCGIAQRSVNVSIDCRVTVHWIRGPWIILVMAWFWCSICFFAAALRADHPNKPLHEPTHCVPRWFSTNLSKGLYVWLMMQDKADHDKGNQ